MIILQGNTVKSDSIKELQVLLTSIGVSHDQIDEESISCEVYGYKRRKILHKGIEEIKEDEEKLDS